MENIKMLLRLESKCSDLKPSPAISVHAEKYNRDQREDLKKAIDYLYEFREKLDALHPSIPAMMQKILTEPNF
jgi:hypothetical protein